MRRVAALLLVFVATVCLDGCAAAYRNYPCGVHYKYCANRPLPFRTYAGCPTPIATEYRTAGKISD